MKSFLFFVTFFLCTPKSYSQDSTLTKDELLRDYDIFIVGLKDGHGGMYYSINSSDFNFKADSIRSTINVNTSNEAFYLKLRFLLTLLCHGHSRINLPNPKPINFKMAILDSNKLYLPIVIRIINENIYIQEDCSVEQNIVQGTQIQAINGHPIKQLISAMQKYMPAEGVNVSFKNYNLSNYYYFHFLYSLLFPSEKSFKISFVGKVNTSIVCARKPNEIAATYFEKNKKGISDFTKPLQYKQLDANYAYIKVGSFYKGFIEYQGQKYQSFLDSTFSDIRLKGKKQVIIDLRDNEGGGDNYAEIFLSYLLPNGILIEGMNRIAGRNFTSKPYTINLSDDIKMIMDNPSEFLENDTSLFLKDKYVKMMDNAGTILPSSKNQFKGDIYVLINGGTFSASDIVVSGLYKNRKQTGRKIVFVGEENGGDIFRNASCSGQSYTLQLPNSKIIVDIPFLCKGILNSLYPPKRLPDIRISDNIGYVIKGKDYLLHQVIKQMGKKTF